MNDDEDKKTNAIERVRRQEELRGKGKHRDPNARDRKQKQFEWLMDLMRIDDFQAFEETLTHDYEIEPGSEEYNLAVNYWLARHCS